MSLLVKIFSVVLLPSLLWAEQPDCVYVGKGNVYTFDGQNLSDENFQLYLERYKTAPGQYFFNEIKTFPDGSKTDYSFWMGWAIGPFGYDSGTGVVVKGLCLDYGYCVGRHEVGNFKGTFVTRFDSHQILTTTTTDKVIIDEVVHPKDGGECPF